MNEGIPPAPSDQHDWVPRPDPSDRTTEALRRDLGALESLIEVKINQVRELVVNLERLHDRIIDERHARYNERFRAQEEAVEKAMAAAEALVDAAFASSEKAITKAEISIQTKADVTYVKLEKMQDLLGDLMTRTESEQRFGDHLERIQNSQNRITILESVKMGSSEQRTEYRQVTAGQIAIIGIGITILLAVLTVISFLT